MLDVFPRDKGIHIERDDVLGRGLELLEHPREHLTPVGTLPERGANVQRHHRFNEAEHVDKRAEPWATQHGLRSHFDLRIANLNEHAGTP